MFFHNCSESLFLEYSRIMQCIIFDHHTKRGDEIIAQLEIFNYPTYRHAPELARYAAPATTGVSRPYDGRYFNFAGKDNYLNYASYLLI